METATELISGREGPDVRPGEGERDDSGNAGGSEEQRDATQETRNSFLKVGKTVVITPVSYPVAEDESAEVERLQRRIMASILHEDHTPTSLKLAAVNEVVGILKEKQKLCGMVQELRKFMMLVLLHPEMARPGMRMIPGLSESRWEFSRLPDLDVQGVLDVKSDCDCECLKFVLQEILWALGNAMGKLKINGDETKENLVQDPDPKPAPPPDVGGVPGGAPHQPPWGGGQWWRRLQCT